MNLLPRFGLVRLLLSGTALGQHIVAFKIWTTDGRVLYSTDPAIVGRQFSVKPALASAFAGEVHSEISDLKEPENEFERQRWPRLLETYAPVRAASTGAILAVSEFYLTTDDLERKCAPRGCATGSW